MKEVKTTFRLRVDVVKTRRDGSDRYAVTIEGNGFAGSSDDAYTISTAFQTAYEDFVAKLIAGTSGE